MQKRLSLLDRAKIAITGSTKDFIPALPSDSGGIFGDVGVPLTTYQTKGEQLAANIGWVYAANSAIVDDIVAVPLKVRQKQSNGDKVEVFDTELHELFAEPTSAHDGETTRALYWDYRNLVGEAYLLQVRDGSPWTPKAGELPHALRLLQAEQTVFKLDKTNYSRSTVRNGQETYQLGQVIRGYNPNPRSIYHGRSVVAAAASAIDSDHHMQSWNRRMFANNARPGLVFNLQGEQISQEVYDRLKSQVDELYTNDGVFRSLVVENGEVKPYMLNAQDLDFLNSRAFTMEEILAMWKVPAAMLGMTKDYNRANIDGARYIHLLNNVVPRLRREMSMWNQQLVRNWKADMEVYFDSPVPEDVEAKIKEASAGVDNWMTIDEVRATRGLDALEDGTGAQLYRPINTAPLPALAGTGKTPPASEGKKSLPKHAA
jgi:HK97 family phage portal protein